MILKCTGIDDDKEGEECIINVISISEDTHIFRVIMFRKNIYLWAGSTVKQTYKRTPRHRMPVKHYACMNYKV